TDEDVVIPVSDSEPVPDKRQLARYDRAEGPPPGVVCRLRAIKGCDLMAAEAHRLVPQNTQKLSDCVVYAARQRVPDREDRVYYHSNFLTPGYAYPTKILTALRTTPDLLTILANI